MKLNLERLKRQLYTYKAKIQTQYNKLNKQKVFTIAGVGAALFSGALYFGLSDSSKITASLPETSIEMGALPIPEVDKKYGFVTDNYLTTEDQIKNGEFLSDILTRHDVAYTNIDKLVKKATDVFDVRKLRAGKKYMVLKNKDTQKAEYFVYEPSVYQYVVYDLRDDMNVSIIDREITTDIQTSSGVINSSLWNAMTDNGMSYDLASRMEEALAWSVDFYHIQKDDKFKLIYEQNYIEGKKVGVGKLLGAYFNHYGNDYYAFYFKNNNHEGYYDLEARPTKKAFLKAPVKYARISSSFNLRRFHPVLKRIKPHLGTDYAAPRGTPILAVADGVVTKASRTRGNGNFVKLRHDKVYETQYLHMNRFAKGIKPGVRVNQGQVIGYVGSTGLATGPHVCYRFWKNGRQVDPRREKLPPPEPMPEKDIEKFNELRNNLKKELDEIPYLTVEEIEAIKAQKKEEAKVNP